MTPNDPRALRPPRQERSRETLDRLVEALEGLLEEKSFEETSVADIARRGRSSVGSFYGRFPDKEALLYYLGSHQEREVRQRWDAYLGSARFEGASAATIVRELVSTWVKAHRRKKSVGRALHLYARTRADEAFLRLARRVNRYALKSVSALLLRRRHEMSHPHPERAIPLGLLMPLSTIRERAFFGERKIYPVSMGDAELAEELTRAFLAYLGVRDGARVRNERR